MDANLIERFKVTRIQLEISLLFSVQNECIQYFVYK